MIFSKYELIRRILTFIKNEKIEIFEHELKRLKNPEFGRKNYPLCTKEYLLLLDELEELLTKDVLSRIELNKLKRKLEKKELREMTLEKELKQIILQEAL